MRSLGPISTSMILLTVYLILPVDAFSQKSESTFSRSENFYSLKTYVGPSPTDIDITIGKEIYSLRAKENFGAGQEKGKLWTELIVNHNDNRYNFLVGKRSISSSQVGMFDVGKTYKLGSDATHPFTTKVQLVSKDKDSGTIKASIIPDGGVPECSEKMPLKLQFRSTSYLMCRSSGNPMILRFEHRPSYGGRMDYPGYVVSSKEDGAFEKVGGFSATSSSRSIEAGSTTFRMRRTRQIRSGEYEDYGSEWIVTAE